MTFRNKENPAHPTSIVKWSRWSHFVDSTGRGWYRYSIRCTDPLPQEMFDKIDFSQTDPKRSFYIQVDEFAAPEEGVQVFAYKTYGFIIPEDALFGDHTLEGQIYPTLS